jgi:hypothetical protein
VRKPCDLEEIGARVFRTSSWTPLPALPPQAGEVKLDRDGDLEPDPDRDLDPDR